MSDINQVVKVMTTEFLKNGYKFSRDNKRLQLYKTEEWLISDKELWLNETVSALELILTGRTPSSYNIDISVFNNINLFEKIYHTLTKKEEKNIFLNLIANKTQLSLYFLKTNLDKINSISFLNDVIISVYNTEPEYHKSYHSIILEVIELHEKKENFSLEEKTLEFLCKNSSHILKDIKNQNILKNFVTEYFPQKVEKLKKHWKKVDLSQVKEENAISEGFGATMTFNKIYLHNLNLNNPEDKTCLKRLRLLVTCLNQKNMHNLLDLKKVMIDGIASAEKNYNFFFSLKNADFPHKEIIKKIIIEVAQNEACSNIKNIEKVINYQMLNNKVNNSVEEKTSKSSFKI